MKTGIGQSKYRNLTLFHVVWSVAAKVFSTVTFSILYILTDLYSTANDPQPQMIPRPQMIPKMDRKWSSTASDPQSRPQMIPKEK